MKFSVGTNWNQDLLDVFRDTKEIYEVYGSPNENIFGNGRPSFILGKVSQDEMKEYIAKLHAMGKEFNCSMNAPCLGNMEFENETHEKLIEYFQWLVDIGVDGVTVSIPYLIEIIKKQFPQLKVKASIIAQIDSVSKAKYYESMGADEIVLHYMINRDFKLLEQFRKSMNCKLSLLVNDACLYNCPYRIYHYNMCGHASQSTHPSKGFYVDYCSLKCTLERLRNPALLLSSRWIRPEDLKIYEELGYDAFKISGRRMNTSWIANTIKAYTSQKYDGNLSDIIDYSLLGMEKAQNTADFKKIIFGAVQLKTDTFLELANFVPVRPNIDNTKLDGFIEHFRQGKCKGICDECGYCASFAKKVIVPDEENHKKQLDYYEKFLDDMVTSKMFLGDKDEKPEEQMEKEEEKAMEWSTELSEKFTAIMDFAPPEFKDFASNIIKTAAEANTEKRGSNVVSEEDMIISFLQNTPAFFYDQMVSTLGEKGIDLTPYKDMMSK